MAPVTEAATTGPSHQASPPVWFWVIAVVALLWFLMDVSMFFMRVLMTEAGLSAMPMNQQHLYRDMPVWVNIVFAGEVFGGVLGSIGLLIRKKWALPLFVVSILGVVSQTFHIWIRSDAISVMGAFAVVAPLVAILIGVGMIVLTRSTIAKGWLR